MHATSSVLPHPARRRRRVARWGWLGWLVLLGSGCASTTAPPGWLQTPKEPSNGRGGWIAVALRVPPDDRKNTSPASRPARGWDFGGELIAVNADSLFVLSGLQLRAAPWDQVRKAQLTGYDPQTAELAVWSVLGTLSTASHGFVLIFTAPLWVISGAASTAKQSRAGVVFCPPGTAQDLAPYARFPQGLPAGVDRSRLGSVPAPVSARPADPFGEAPPTPAAEPGSPLLPRPRWSTDAPASA